MYIFFFFFFQAEDGIRDKLVTGVQTCALPISPGPGGRDREGEGRLRAQLSPAQRARLPGHRGQQEAHHLRGGAPGQAAGRGEGGGGGGGPAAHRDRAHLFREGRGRRQGLRLSHGGGRSTPP